MELNLDSFTKKYVMGVISGFFTESKITFSLSAGFKGPNGEHLNEQQVSRDFNLYTLMHDQVVVPGKQSPVKITQQHFKEAFQGHKETLFKEAVRAAIKLIQYKPEKQAPGQGPLAISKWLKSVIFREPTDVEIAAIMQFMHQVKRKLMGLPIRNHLMPVIVSAQGTGKTKSIEWLLSPLGKLAAEWDFAKLEDQRFDIKHANTYVMFFDELARAEKADMKTLKQRITSSTIEVRYLYSMDFVSIPQNTTFIATSNEPIEDLLKDTTGMRRFYQIQGASMNEIDRASYQQFWDLKNELDPVGLWQAVNENVEVLPEYQEALEAMQKEQEELRHKDSVEEFIIESDLEKDPEKDSAMVRLEALYKDYISYCEAAGLSYPVSRQFFRKRLIAKLKCTAKKKNAGWYMGIRRKNSSQLAPANSNAALSMLKLGAKRGANDKDNDEASDA